LAQLRVYLNKNIMHNNSVRMKRLQVGGEKKNKIQLDEAADRKKLKQLCVKQRVCSALLSSQRQFAAQVGLGFYERLARLPCLRRKNDFEKVKTSDLDESQVEEGLIYQKTEGSQCQFLHMHSL
jgi:hypothetical protein